MTQERPGYDELREMVRRQQRQIGDLLTENARLRAELEEAWRAGKRRWKTTRGIRLAMVSRTRHRQETCRMHQLVPAHG